MKVIEMKHFGAPDVLHIAQREQPILQPGEVLIKISAFGVNRPDIFQRQGAYPPPEGITDILGLEVAGEIVACADLTAQQNPFQLKKGDKVCALVAGGGYAEYVAAPIVQCLPIPTGLSELEAASLPETYFTVWANLFNQTGLGAYDTDETVLIQGGSSGIGVAAIQLAKAFAFRVFATAGSSEKCAACEQLGAERVINYRVEDFVHVIQDCTAKKGVDVILDMVAGDYVARELECLAHHGRLIFIATLGGKKAQIDCAKMMFKHLMLCGSTLRSRSIAQKGQIAQALVRHVWPLFATKKVKPVIDRVFPAHQVVLAHEWMEKGTHIGKIMLSWND